jgi:hypothetical protein
MEGNETDTPLFHVTIEFFLLHQQVKPQTWSKGSRTNSDDTVRYYRNIIRLLLLFVDDSIIIPYSNQDML